MVVACGGYYFYALTPVGNGSKKVDFVIQEGESYDNVLNNLDLILVETFVLSVQ